MITREDVMRVCTENSTKINGSIRFKTFDEAVIALEDIMINILKQEYPESNVLVIATCESTEEEKKVGTFISDVRIFDNNVEIVGLTLTIKYDGSSIKEKQ